MHDSQYQKNVPEDHGEEEKYQWLDLGVDTEEEIQSEIQNTVREIEEAGMSKVENGTLQNMRIDFEDVLRLRPVNYPLDMVEPKK